MNLFVYSSSFSLSILLFYFLCSGNCSAQIHAGGSGDGYDYFEIKINPNSLPNNPAINQSNKPDAILISDGKIPSELLKKLDAELSYTIYNSTGSLIWNGNLNSLKMLSLQQFSSGIYILSSKGTFISYLQLQGN